MRHWGAPGLLGSQTAPHSQSRCLWWEAPPCLQQGQGQARGGWVRKGRARGRHGRRRCHANGWQTPRTPTAAAGFWGNRGNRSSCHGQAGATATAALPFPMQQRPRTRVPGDGDPRDAQLHAPHLLPAAPGAHPDVPLVLKRGRGWGRGRASAREGRHQEGGEDGRAGAGGRSRAGAPAAPPRSESLRNPRHLTSKQHPSCASTRTSYTQSGASCHQEGQEPTMVGPVRCVAEPS